MSGITDSGREATAASGRFLLRIDPNLHAALRDAADRAGISLNEYCSRRLGVPATASAGAGGSVVQRAAAMFGAALQAVVVFGSWARGESALDSDVDVLVVVDGSVAITRDLYRRWDGEVVTWESRPLDCHFAHLPESAADASGMWNDVAMDGVTLYDRDLKLSQLLVEIRARVVSGQLSRRFAHGQSYWVEEARNAQP